ncbi:MAG: tRNA pseudouridine synthase A [Sulfolobaceae archaeon]
MKFYPFIYDIDNFCNYVSKWIIRKDEETSEKYGEYPDKRRIESLIRRSIINLDKPPGPTSHEVAFWVKQMFGLNKVGHGGTLEPNKWAGKS